MRVSIICLLLTVLAACTVILEPEDKPTVDVVAVAEAPADNEIVLATTALADSLFDVAGLISPDSNIAVGTFGQIDTLALSANDSQEIKQLSRQIQEGLKIQLARKRIRVVEFRLRNSIALKPGQDMMLSRELDQIQQHHDIDYFLTGTLSELPNGVIINAQLVDVQSKQIVTAATKTLSADYWHGPSASTVSNNMIYRGEK